MGVKRQVASDVQSQCKPTLVFEEVLQEFHLRAFMRNLQIPKERLQAPLGYKILDEVVRASS